MKKIYVNDLKNGSTIGSEVILYGWIKSKRQHGNIAFLDVCDSTGSIQIVVDATQVSESTMTTAKTISSESAVKIEGLLVEKSQNGNSIRELNCSNIEIISLATRNITQNPRSDVDIFDTDLADHLLKNRHFYLRNEKIMAILRVRHTLMGGIHQWFRDNGFIEITAPVLTSLPLYDDGTAMSLKIHDDKEVFLTQCVGFYLESAVHAFEKVYNMGPSFRRKESRSKRHLMEYWHIKAEIAFADLEDIISLVENLVSYSVKYCEKECPNSSEVLNKKFCTDGLTTPFPRISYRKAVSILQEQGVEFEFGKSLGSDEEKLLSIDFKTPFWITGIPRSIEPFPYVIDPNDSEVTKTADLIATNGYGELLGVAEKITDPLMLEERMIEKNKINNENYNWIREMREFGCVPHAGFGMGVERFIRWILNIPHVRDAIPFPRTFRRKIYP